MVGHIITFSRFAKLFFIPLLARWLIINENTILVADELDREEWHCVQFELIDDLALFHYRFMHDSLAVDSLEQI